MRREEEEREKGEGRREKGEGKSNGEKRRNLQKNTAQKPRRSKRSPWHTIAFERRIRSAFFFCKHCAYGYISSEKKIVSERSSKSCQ